mmetsp:Transcript_13319/g.20210  ORF Transcript_13319/g.20210 Transcript_13319/m.20210 type:complete len:147 (-) Transcript_13319:23-463(-)
MYKGIEAYKVLCLKPAIQFTVFEQVKKILIASKTSSHKKQLSATEAFFLGMAARAVATVVVFPFIRAKVMAQANSDSDNNKSMLETVVAMHREGGLSQLFQGLGPELTRGVLSAALMMMVKEQIAATVKAAILPSKQRIQTKPSSW